jgi:hypothetical protein
MRLLERDVAPLFNGVLAAVTAIAAAFATFAMPNDLFSGLVAATGLPALLPAAEPPLGATARLAAVAAVSVLAFLVVWFVLGAIDDAAEEQEEFGDYDEPEEESDTDWEPQMRLRRADAHPDAPPRQPLLAKRELGEPVENSLSEDEPDWMNPQPLAEELGIPEAAAAEPYSDEHLELTGPDELPTEEPDPRDPRSWFEPAPEELPCEEIAQVEPVWPFENQAKEAAEPAPEPLEPAAEATQPAAADDGTISTEALMAKLPLPEDRGESISSLFQRLDTGLANVEWPLADSPEPEANAGPEPEGKGSVSHQLRDALGDLQRMANRRS